MPDLNLNSDANKNKEQKPSIFGESKAEEPVDLAINPKAKINWKLIAVIGGLIFAMVMIGIFMNLPATEPEDGSSIGEQLTGSFKKAKPGGKADTSQAKCTTKIIGGKKVTKCAGTSTVPEESKEDSSGGDLIDGSKFGLGETQNLTDLTGGNDQNLSFQNENTKNLSAKEELKTSFEEKFEKGPDLLSSCSAGYIEGPPDPSTGQPSCIPIDDGEPVFAVEPTAKEEPAIDQADFDKAAKALKEVISLAKKIEQYEKTSSSYKDQAEKAEESIDKKYQNLKKSSDKKLLNELNDELEKTIDELEKNIADIRKKLKEGESALKKINTAIKLAEGTLPGLNKTKFNELNSLVKEAKTVEGKVDSYTKKIRNNGLDIDKTLSSLKKLSDELRGLADKLQHGKINEDFEDVKDGSKNGQKSTTGGTTTVNQTELACNQLKDKYDSYKIAVNSVNASAIEKEVDQYLLDKVIVKGLEQKCTFLSNAEAKADKCQASNKEMFNTKINACSSIPGYYKIDSGAFNADCNELDTALAAISLKQLDKKLDDDAKLALAALKLDLSSNINYCETLKKQADKAAEEKSKPKGGGGGAPKGGGGGSAGSFSNTYKDFEIDNVQVIPEEFNPFAEQVKVHFFLTKEAFVSAEIIDEAEVIRELAEQKLNPGDRFFAWDGRDKNGDFVPEKDYTFKIIAKKSTNKNNILEEEGSISVKYFDEQFELSDPGVADFEDFEGGVSFGAGFDSGTAIHAGALEQADSSGQGPKISSHGVSSPLAQSIHLEGRGKTTTSNTGPEHALYLLLLLPLYFIWRPAYTKKK